MTARDEAATVIADLYHQWVYPTADTGATRNEAAGFGEIVAENIPPNVLARLAIEQGALEEQSLAAWWMQDTDPNQPLFRLVGP